MAKRKAQAKLMLIQWYDHASNDGWVEQDALKKEKLKTITSIGWVVRDDPEKYVIAAGFCNEDKDYTNLQTIAKALVINTKVVRQ